MPTVIIHEEVAYLMTKKYQELDQGDFYLGALAPDAPNLHGFAPKELRWTAHLRDENLDIWLNNVKEFYQNNEDKYNKYFLLGYVFHIITDIVYDRSFYGRVIEKIQRDNIKKEDQHDVIRDSMLSYGYETAKEPFFSEIKKKLQNVSGYNIRNIEKETLIAWKNKCLSNHNSENNKNKKNKYITKNDIIELTSKVEEEFISIYLSK